jgi:RNA polymerase sigma-70 factor (ECF subfamily)
VTILGFFGRSRHFENLISDYRPRLWRLAYSWCSNRHLADDLVQDACTKALHHHAQLREADALGGWLCRILANVWNDHLRARKNTTDIDDVAESELPEIAGPEDDYSLNETVRRVRLAVAELPAGQREVVTLVDLEEFSYAEVATILEIPIGTVMSRLSRARLSLREMLREQPAADSLAEPRSASVHRLRA